MIYSPSATYIPSLRFKQHLLLEISCLQGFGDLTSGDLKWPLTSMKNNRDHLLTKGYQRAKFEVQASLTSLDIVFTRFYKVFRLWPLFTSNDLWPPWNTIQIIFSPSATYIPSLKFRQHSLLEISCLQSFHTLTSGDLKWPLTSMKNNRDHLLTKAYQVPSLKFKQLLLLEISCLQARRHTRTHTHTHIHTHTHTHTHAITIA